MEGEQMHVEQPEELVESEHCPKCFKRRVIGASDVYNAYSKLDKGLKMQLAFIEKHKEADKIPRTMDTRIALAKWFEAAEASFKSEFGDKMMPACDLEHALISKKRKRAKKSE